MSIYLPKKYLTGLILVIEGDTKFFHSKSFPTYGTTYVSINLLIEMQSSFDLIAKLKICQFCQSAKYNACQFFMLCGRQVWPLFKNCGKP